MIQRLILWTMFLVIYSIRLVVSPGSRVSTEYMRVYLIRKFYIIHFALSYIAPQLYHITSRGKLVYLVNICIQMIGANTTNQLIY